MKSFLTAPGRSRPRAWLAAALFAVTLVAGDARAAGRFGDIYPRGNPDGLITLGDLLLIRSFALRGVEPTVAELNSANVFPLAPCITCLPGEVRYPDLATRFLGGDDNAANDAGDITLGDVLIIEKAILGEINLGEGLALLSAGAINPSSGDTFGADPVTIAGGGFEVEAGQILRVAFIFPQPSGPAVRLECDVPFGMTPASVDCAPDGMGFISISDTQIQILTPNANGELPPGEFQVTAAVQVLIVDNDGPDAGTVLQATPEELTAQNSYTFARGSLDITALGGNGQAGFPLIELGVPLETFVYDLVAQQPATSYTADPLTAPYVTFRVDIVGNCPALLNDTDFDLTLPIDGAGRTQVRVTPLDTCASGEVVVEAIVTNVFGAEFIPTTATQFVLPVADADQGVIQIVSGSGQICPFNTTCASNFAAETPEAAPLTVNIIDRYGVPVSSTISIQYQNSPGEAVGGLTLPQLSQGSGSSCGSPGTTLLCTGSPAVRANITTGGSASASVVSGEYVVRATSTTNPVPGTFTNAVPVVPETGVTFRVRAERPAGTTIEYTSEVTQADREADLTNDLGPYAMGVMVRDQWGRPAPDSAEAPVCVTYAVQSSGFATLPSVDLSGGDPSLCPVDQQVPPNQRAITTASGAASQDLLFTGSASAGVLTVRAAITARPSTFVDFRFALGLLNRPPPPVNIARVEIFHPIENNLSAGSDGTIVSSFIVRGALGSVVKSPDDPSPFGSGVSNTRYSVKADDGAGITNCVNISNGITGGVGLTNTGDVNQGRFELTLTPPPETGQIALTVYDDVGCTGEASVSKLVSYTSRFDVGYVSNRTLSQLDRIGIDYSTATPEVASVDTDQTFGLQTIRSSGLKPLGIAFFSSDPGAFGEDGQPLMDRAVVVNSGSGDLSVIRIAEEVLVQGNDLNLVGGTTNNVVESLSSDFLVERNYDCNRGIDLGDFTADASNDCSVSAGDVLIVRPGSPLETRRVITAVEGVPGASNRLVLNGTLNPVQVSVPGVEFRIVSRYREIDGDNDQFTTSLRAEPGITRIRVPYPDRGPSCESALDPNAPPVFTAPCQGRQSSGVTIPVSPRYAAVFAPDGGIDGVTMGRVFVSDPIYNVLYVFNLSLDFDNQLHFDRPDTSVATTGTPQPSGVIPLLALRETDYSATLSFAGATQLVVDHQDSDGDGDRDMDDEAYLYAVVESDPNTGGPTHGGLSVFSLTPDPESDETDGDEWTDDEEIRFPFQGNTACGGSPCYGYTTALCQEPEVPGSREWVLCEIDTDFDPYTSSYSALQSSVCFDTNGDTIPDNYIAAQSGSCAGAPGADSVSVPVPDPNRNTGITMILGRQTNLPGDFLSDQFTLTYAEFQPGGAYENVYRYSNRPLRFWQPFRFEKPQVPYSLEGRVRRDIGFLTVRATTNDPSADALNDRPQSVYPVDVRPDLSRSGLPLPSSRPGLGLTISFDGILTGTGSGQGYSNHQCVLDPNGRVTGSPNTTPDQREEDDIVTVPVDVDVAVAGLPGGGLYGTDGIRATADDRIQPQDVLLLKTSGGGSRVYRYTVVGLHASDPIRFTIRADGCDGLPPGTITQFRIMDSMNVVDMNGSFNASGLPAGITLTRTQSARTATLGGGIVRALAHAVSVRDDRDTTGSDINDRDDRFTLMISISNGFKNAGTDTTPTTVAMLNLFDPGNNNTLQTDDLGCLRVYDGIADSGPPSVSQETLCAEMQGQNVLAEAENVFNLGGPPANQNGGATVIAATDKLGFLFNSTTSQLLQFRHERQAPDAGHANKPWLQASPYPPLTYNEIPFEATEAYPNLFAGDARGVWTRIAYDLAETDARQRIFVTMPAANAIAVAEQRDFTEIAPPLYVARAVDTDNVTGEQSVRINTGYSPTGAIQRLDRIEKSFYYGTSVGESVLFVSEDPGVTGRHDLNVIDPQVDAELDQNADLPGVNGLSTDTSADADGYGIHSVIVDEGRERVYSIAQIQLSQYRIVAHDLNTGAEVNLVTPIADGSHCVNVKQIEIVTDPITGALPQSFAIRDNLLLVGYSAGSVDAARLFWLNLDNLSAADFNANCQVNFQAGNSRTVERGSGNDAYPRSVEALRIEGDRAFAAGTTGATLKVSTIDLTQFWRWRSGGGCAESVCRPKDASVLTPKTFPLNLETGGGGTVIEIRTHGSAAFVLVNRTVTPFKRIYVLDTSQYTVAPVGGTDVTFSSPVKVATIDAPASSPRATIVGPGWLVVPSSERDSSGNNLTLINLQTPVWSRTTPPSIPAGSVHQYSVGADNGEIRDFEFTTLPPP